MAVNKFKGNNNAWLTMGLFVETLSRTHRDVIDTDRCLYWLEDKKDDNDKRPVFKDLYIKLKDPTGVKAAKLYLDGYAHFEYLMETAPWFKEAIDKWNREIEATLRSESIQRMRELAEDASGEAVKLAANKYLANKEYKKDSTPRRGRPTAEEIKGELKHQTRSSNSIQEDLQRMKGIN